MHAPVHIAGVGRCHCRLRRLGFVRAFTVPRAWHDQQHEWLDRFLYSRMLENVTTDRDTAQAPHFLARPSHLSLLKPEAVSLFRLCVKLIGPPSTSRSNRWL